MNNAVDFRRMAYECTQLAEDAEAAKQSSLLRLASHWQALAIAADLEEMGDLSKGSRRDAFGIH
jgi:hypothetical protein